MTYSLTQLAADIRETLKADSGGAAKDKICGYVLKALTDKSFVAAHLKTGALRRPSARGAVRGPRAGVLHLRPRLHDGPAHGSPHDHGSSWAIYGQAVGVTEMTDWRIVEKGRATSRRWSRPSRPTR